MKSKILYTAFIAICLAGCETFVEIDPPIDRLVTEKVFERDESAVSTITGLYTSMIGDANFPFPYNIELYTGLYADELTYHLTDIPRSSVYKNLLNPVDALTNSIWVRGYNFIYQANSIIDGVKTSVKMTDPVRNQLTGEALFVRALWHFYLCNLYGDIPIAISTDYSINSKMSRKSSTLVYEQIIDDLLISKKLLSIKYVGANSVSDVIDRFRPNTFTASALLSRVYLFTGKWAKSEEEATRIINESSLYQLEDIEDIFKKGSKETIWQLPMPTSSAGAPLRENTWEAKYFFLIAKPNVLNSGSSISPQLYGSLTDSDLRKSNWVGVFKDGVTNIYFPTKYKSLSLTTVEEHSICFRLAEQFLIRAEARVRQNMLAEAISDIDKIKLRAGVPLIGLTSPNITNDEFIVELFEERRKELFCEWGHRWLDLKRTNTVDSQMRSIQTAKGITWLGYMALWPIPQTDLLNSINLKQNDGYN